MMKNQIDAIDKAVANAERLLWDGGDEGNQVNQNLCRVLERGNLGKSFEVYTAGEYLSEIIMEILCYDPTGKRIGGFMYLRTLYEMNGTTNDVEVQALRRAVLHQAATHLKNQVLIGVVAL